MGIYSIKPKFRELLSPLLKLLWNVHPDVLTWSALGCSVLVGTSFQWALEHRWLFLTVPVLVFIRIALNALDGLLAQATGKARAFGEVLNETTDRLSDLAILFGIALSPLSSLAWGAPAIALVLLSSYVGILSKAVGVKRQYGGILGKADRMFWLGAACLAAFWLGNPAVVGAMRMFDALLAGFAVLAAVTTIQRVAAIHRALQEAPKGGGGR